MKFTTEYLMSDINNPDSFFLARHKYWWNMSSTQSKNELHTMCLVIFKKNLLGFYAFK